MTCRCKKVFPTDSGFLKNPQETWFFSNFPSPRYIYTYLPQTKLSPLFQPNIIQVLDRKQTIISLIVGNRATRPYLNYKQYADQYARFLGFPSIGCNGAPCLQILVNQRIHKNLCYILNIHTIADIACYFQRSLKQST